MTPIRLNPNQDSDGPSTLAKLVLAVPPGRRGALLQCVVSCRPNTALEDSFKVGPLRAAFADYWETTYGSALPIQQLRAILDPPVPMKTVLEFSRFMLARDITEVESALQQLVEYLNQRLAESNTPSQQHLFEPRQASKDSHTSPIRAGETVASLHELVDRGRRFPTIYADPPWPYQNQASRAAVVNHYPTMSVSDICAEPVSQLAEQNAHLHLWTTNAFLQDAFHVIDAWGFKFKSCLIWVKNEIGLGNYWRVSHEFLLLGVRGKLTFRDRTLTSWIQASRTIHSRKPATVRLLVERASPPPYLELYGREELPNSAWTVYGNQVKRSYF
jgi:N6-adenosine-specific RNA methylase IME4